MNWPQDRLDRLRNLWPNFSATQIAAELGDGITRSAVLGMAHRLHLGAKRLPPIPRITRAVRTTPFRKPKPLPVQPSPPLAPSPSSMDWSAVAEAMVDLPTAPVTLTELTHKTCRYPIGDVLPYLYCGKPPLETSPYCAQHHSGCYYPPRASGRPARLDDKPRS